jgi:hypothetical protein
MTQDLQLREVESEPKEPSQVQSIASNPSKPGSPRFPSPRKSRKQPESIRLKRGTLDPFTSQLVSWVRGGCDEAAWKSLIDRKHEPGAPPWLNAEPLGLDDLSHKILLLAIAHLIHQQGSLEDDPFEPREDFDGCCLIKHLSLPAPGGVFEVAKRLAPDAPLRTRGYFHSDDYSNNQRGGPSSISVSRFLRNENSLNINALGPLLGLVTAEEEPKFLGMNELVLPESMRETLSRLLLNPPPLGKSFWIYLKGPQQSGRRSLAQALAHELGRPLRPTRPCDGPQPGTCLLVNLDKAWDEDDWGLIKDHPGWIFLRPIEANLNLKLETRSDLVLDFTSIEKEARVQFWANLLKVQTLLGSLNPTEMALVDAPPGRIIQSIQKVAQLTSWKDLTSAELETRLKELLLESSEATSGAEYATQVVPQRTLNELCLEPEAMERFQRILKSIRGRSAMLSRWNLDPGLVGKAKGVLLFHGASGTGKSMAAQVLAHELNLPLLRMEAAELESAYVGETEKRIHHFLASTKGKPSVLLLDEADSMLMDRSHAEGSTRRYQVNLVNTWLRELDQFDGILAFTTNHADLDPAMERRIMYRMEFKTPTKEVRKRLWESLFQKAPIPGHEELDLSSVAEQFDFTGGRTRLAFLDALQRAAEVGQINQQILLASCLEEKRSALPGMKKPKQIRGFSILQHEAV